MSINLCQLNLQDKKLKSFIQPTGKIKIHIFIKSTQKYVKSYFGEYRLHNEIYTNKNDIADTNDSKNKIS